MKKLLILLVLVAIGLLIAKQVVGSEN